MTWMTWMSVFRFCCYLKVVNEVISHRLEVPNMKCRRARKRNTGTKKQNRTIQASGSKQAKAKAGTNSDSYKDTQDHLQSTIYHDH